MKNIEQLHGELMATTEMLTGQLRAAAELPSGAQASLDQWRQVCARSGQALADRWVRVAAIGAIKSGKSTLVNALLGGDHLRRGAGVVTSIVTRVRRGDGLRARLYFKSWQVINSDIRQALVLFPDGDGDGLDTLAFDLRNDRHREALAQGLAGLSGERLIRSDARDPNSVLLDAYLRGYPQAAPLIDERERHLDYDGEAFREHQAFVADDALAVYLRDIQLEIPMDNWVDRVELADCQGSDSPNPHHLAMIQDYLIRAHLLIYVISSRTGLRQADMKFIAMLQQMGAMDNILFVINCDLTEHDHLDDLDRVVTRTREELLALTPKPQVYTFSALYQLFARPAAQLSPKDGARLAAWQADREMVAFVDAQRTAFESALTHKLEVEGFSVQAAAHIGRLDTVQTGFGQWLELSRRLHGQDAAAAQELQRRLEAHRERMRRSRPMLKSALAGAVGEIKSELRRATDRFFDPHSGEAVGALMAVVADPEIDLETYAGALQKDKFSDILYRLLQAYRRQVDRAMAEILNPALVHFVRTSEERLAEMLSEVGLPHAEMVGQALGDYQRVLSEEGHPPESLKTAPDTLTRVDLDALRRELALELPTAQAALEYGLQLKGEALLHLGIDRFVHWVRRLVGRTGRGAAAPVPGGSGQRALKAALKRMRKEMESSIRSHLMNHRENIKYQYLLKLADAAGEALHSQLTAHYGAYLADLAASDDAARGIDEDAGQDELATRLAALSQTVREVGERLQSHRLVLEALIRSDSNQ